jgi:hypothetical protein
VAGLARTQARVDIVTPAPPQDCISNRAKICRITVWFLSKPRIGCLPRGPRAAPRPIGASVLASTNPAALGLIPHDFTAGPIRLHAAARHSLTDYSYEAREKFRVVADPRSTNRSQTSAGSRGRPPRASIIEILLALEGDDREILVSTYSFIGATRARLLFHHGTQVMRLVDASNAHAPPRYRSH